MSKREKICGIYKITSPSGRVYIGESVDILTRWVSYKNLSCKGQPKLLRSLKKYSPENHIFEIIEQCKSDELKCRERYWQDFYDVLNGGLNCRLTECGELKAVTSQETIEKIREAKIGEKNPMFGRKGELNPLYGIKKTPEQIRKNRENYVPKRGEEHHSWGYKHTEEANEKNRQAHLGKNTGWDSPVAKPTINTQTEKVYPSVTEAFKDSGMENYDYFKAKLNGNRKNDTYFMYLEDYEKYGALEPKTIKPDKTEVRDTLTLKKYNSITEASKDLGIKSSSLTRYLSGVNSNITYCVYEKDYIEGVIHYPEEPKPVNKVIDNITGIIYNSVKETSEKTGVKLNTLKGYLAGNNQKTTDFQYYKE